MGRASRQPPTRLAEKLKVIRESLGLSQGEMLRQLSFSEEDGLFRSSISGYELSTRIPPLNIILQYSRIANIFVEVLIDDLIDLPIEIPAKKKSGGTKVKKINSSSNRD